MSNYRYKNKDFSEEDVIKAAKTANLSVDDYVNKHKITRVEDKVDPSVSLENVRKGTTPEFKSSHISLEDLNVDRGEGLWGVKALGVEGNVYENLKDHYKGTGVSIRQARGGVDAIEIKNKANNTEIFVIPSNFNKYMWKNVGGNSEMKDFHKKITDFIANGNKNIDPELEAQQKTLDSEILKTLDNVDAIKELIPDWSGNWNMTMNNDDDEYNDLLKGVQKQFGEGTDYLNPFYHKGDALTENVWFEFNKNYSKLSETDYQFALEKLVALKAQEQTNALAKIKNEKHKETIGDKNNAAEIHKSGEELTYDTSTFHQKLMIKQFAVVESLIGVEGREKDLLDAQKKLDFIRKNIVFGEHPLITGI